MMTVAGAFLAGFFQNQGFTQSQTVFAVCRVPGL